MRRLVVTQEQPTVTEQCSTPSIAVVSERLENNNLDRCEAVKKVWIEEDGAWPNWQLAITAVYVYVNSSGLFSTTGPRWSSSTCAC